MERIALEDDVPAEHHRAGWKERKRREKGGRKGLAVMN